MLRAPAMPRSYFKTLVAALLGVAVAASACKKPKGWEEREVDYGLVEVAGDRVAVRHDTVGEGRFAAEATFVLVDAKNTHGEDLMVTLGGELVDADGRSLGDLGVESLRIPRGGTRMFALIDKERVKRAAATGARVRVVGAHVVEYVPPVQITDDRVVREGDRVSAYATVNNTKPRHVKVIVMAGFYDENDVPMTRPFTLMQLAGETTHPAEFHGPAGSHKGYLFVGEMVY